MIGEWCFLCAVCCAVVFFLFAVCYERFVGCRLLLVDCWADGLVCVLAVVCCFGGCLWYAAWCVVCCSSCGVCCLMFVVCCLLFVVSSSVWCLLVDALMCVAVRCALLVVRCLLFVAVCLLWFYCCLLIADYWLLCVFVRSACAVVGCCLARAVFFFCVGNALRVACCSVVAVLVVVWRSLVDSFCCVVC